MDTVLYCAVIASLTDHASRKVLDTFFFPQNYNTPSVKCRPYLALTSEEGCRFAGGS